MTNQELRDRINRILPQNNPIAIDYTINGVLLDIINTLEANTAISTALLLNKSVTDVSHTGDLVEFKMYSVLIPANTFASGNIIRLTIRSRKTGLSGTGTVRARFGTSDDLTGTLLATYQHSTTTLFAQSERTLLIKDSTHMETIIVSSSLFSDNVASASAVASVTVNLAVNNYLVVSVQNSNTGDVTTFSGITLEKL